MGGAERSRTTCDGGRSGGSMGSVRGGSEERTGEVVSSEELTNHGEALRRGRYKEGWV